VNRAIRLRRASLTVIVVAVAAGASGGEGLAHETSYETTIGYRNFAGYPGNALLSGRVESARPGCMPRRTVKLVVTRPSTQKDVLDKAKTSENGGYGLHGSFNGDDIADVKVTRRNIGRHGHKHICKAVEVNEYTPGP
jgi:hypothetical protein